MKIYKVTMQSSVLRIYLQLMEMTRGKFLREEHGAWEKGKEHNTALGRQWLGAWGGKRDPDGAFFTDQVRISAFSLEWWEVILSKGMPWLTLHF